MQNVVQNDHASYESEMTINGGTSKFFSEMKNSSIPLFLKDSKLPTPPKYPYFNVYRINSIQTRYKVQKYKKMLAGRPRFEIKLRIQFQKPFPSRPFAPFPSNF